MPGSGETTIKRPRPTIHGALAHPQGIPRGFLRLYVLHRIAARPAHGYDLLQEIENKTEGVWRPGAGSIYPILKELVRGGYIRAEAHKKTGKPQHVYHITSEGRALLQQSGEMLLKTGQNWGAMRSILIELVDPKNIPTVFTHMTADNSRFSVESSNRRRTRSRAEKSSSCSKNMPSILRDSSIGPRECSRNHEDP